MIKQAYVLGCEDAADVYKVAKYITDTDKFEKAMQRHMSADPDKEKNRLRQKGEGRGATEGKIVGGLLGGLGGLALGGMPGAALGATGGFVGGGELGRWLGGRAGEREFASRSELAKEIQDLPPKEQRRRLERIEDTRRQQELVDINRAQLYRDAYRRYPYYYYSY